MAYVFCTATCINCHNLFSFNPYIVPSVRVNEKGEQDINGEKEPICKPCVKRANPIREANGLKPIPILRGAYEAAEE